jgi:FkbM family methyltransferase
MLRANELRLPAAAPALNGGRRTIFRRLADSPIGYRLLQGLGRYYGIEAVSAHGELGLITGPLDDAAVLRSYLAHGYWARAANQFFCDFFTRADGGSYIDVGANLGLTTIPVARNPRVTCRAFEPAPRNFKYLWHNIAENCPHGNVGAVNAALFDRQTTLDMVGDAWVFPSDPADSDEEPAPDTVRVRAERLDDVLALDQLPRPIAAKIAAHGAEGRVVAGGLAVLGAADALVLEFDPGLIQEVDRNITVITSFLARNFTTAAPLRGLDFEPGSGPETLVWRPISVMIEQMHAVMEGASEPGADCYYIYVRR